MASQGRQAADDQLVITLACGSTVENAAQKTGLSESTAYRRLRDRKFRTRLNQFRADMVGRAAGMLTAAAMEAVKTLVELQDRSTPAMVRLNAARAILELGTKLRESAELTERISALEEQLYGTDKSKPKAKRKPKS